MAQPWQIQPINIGAIFSMASQMKQLEQRKEELAFARGQQEKERAFAEKAQLLKLKNDFAKEQREQAGETRAAEKHALETGSARSTNTARMLKESTEALASAGYDPAAMMRLAQPLADHERRGLVDPGTTQRFTSAMRENPIAQRMATLAGQDPTVARAQAYQGLEDQAGVTLGALAPEKPGTGAALFQKAANMLGYGPGSPRGGYEDAWADPKLQTEMRRLSAESAPKGTMVELSTGTKKSAEEKLISIEDTLYDLDRMEELATTGGVVDFDQFVSAVPQFGKKLGDVSVKLLGQGAIPAQYREQYKKMVAWRGIVDKYRSEEFRKLLGASQTSTEIANLADAVLSADMNSVQFEQAFGELRGKLSRVAEVRRGLLSKDIDVTKLGARERGRLIDDAMGVRPKPRNPPAGQSVKVGDIRVHPVHGRVRLRPDGKWDPVD